jgi:gentisate 1,2-dioxygenase
MATQYEKVKQLAKESDARGRAGPIVMHTKDKDYGGTSATRPALISEPQILGSIVQTMAMAINEIPPGQKMPRHRHLSEHLLYILSGKGHTEVDGENYSWEEGDVIATPLNAWHQHFNDDPARSVRYLGVNNSPLLRAMSLTGREEDSR